MNYIQNKVRSCRTKISDNLFNQKDIAADRPSEGCPGGSNGCNDIECPNTCFCEDHCSWKKCKLDKPLQNCLIQAKRNWVYDHRNNHWRTSLGGNAIEYHLN